ncbi:universal stress protein [Actinacidiphila alni]|uniref:universal stress protein n=1 Tax=Actinacidiphila alni TaxID=380248 RepID=UPI003451D388
MTRTVVAGVDGSRESVAAADWAAREALLRGLPLRLVHAWEWPPYDDGSASGTASADPQRHWAERIPRETRSALLERYPGLTVTADQIAAAPAAALLSAAADAELLVLGSHGRSGVEHLLTGSVALAVVARATRPAVLVRAGTAAEDGPYGDVVLGLDLVRPSEAVLGFAFDAAARRGAVLHVVHGWNPPSVYGYAPAAVAPDLGAEMAGYESDALARALAPWREKFPELDIVPEAVIGSAAGHLVEAASDASLVVLGRRPRPIAPGPRIGSVSRAVLHRVTAPVAVVPHE